MEQQDIETPLCYYTTNINNPRVKTIITGEQKSNAGTAAEFNLYYWEGNEGLSIILLNHQSGVV